MNARIHTCIFVFLPSLPEHCDIDTDIATSHVQAQLVAPLDIDAIHKAEKEAKRTKVFLLRNAGLPVCPRRLPYMSNLREVDLSSNRIVEMPFDIGELHKLRILNLSFNYLASLPPSIGDLVILRNLNVAHNVLEAVPEQIGELAFAS